MSVCKCCQRHISHSCRCIPCCLVFATTAYLYCSYHTVPSPAPPSVLFCPVQSRLLSRPSNQPADIERKPARIHRLHMVFRCHGDFFVVRQYYLKGTVW